jgi:cation transporter-like permease
MDYYKRILKESILIVIISSLFGLISGSVLSFNQEILYAFPVILLLNPALNSLIGDISIVLVSRLTTHLYIGTISPKIERSNRLKEDFIGLFITIILSIIFLLIIGYSFAFFTNVKIVNPLLVGGVVLLTILILFLSLFISLFVTAIALFRRNKDPNNFLIPFVSSLADFLTPFFIILFIAIFK